MPVMVNRLLTLFTLTSVDDEFSAFSWHHRGSAVLELIVFSGCQMASRSLALSLTKYGSAHFEFTRGVKYNL